MHEKEKREVSKMDKSKETEKSAIAKAFGGLARKLYGKKRKQEDCVPTQSAPTDPPPFPDEEVQEWNESAERAFREWQAEVTWEREKEQWTKDFEEAFRKFEKQQKEATSNCNDRQLSAIEEPNEVAIIEEATSIEVQQTDGVVPQPQQMVELMNDTKHKQTFEASHKVLAFVKPIMEEKFYPPETNPPAFVVCIDTMYFKWIANQYPQISKERFKRLRALSNEAFRLFLVSGLIEECHEEVTSYLNANIDLIRITAPTYFGNNKQIQIKHWLAHGVTMSFFKDCKELLKQDILRGIYLYIFNTMLVGQASLKKPQYRRNN